MTTSVDIKPVIAVPEQARPPLEESESAHERRVAVSADLLTRACATTDEQERGRLQHEVVVLNAGIARAVASRYRNRGIDFEDLTQVAFLGMWKAMQRFDPARGKDFLTFAIPTIRGEIKRYFRDNGWTVRPPRRIQEMQGKVSAAVEALTHDLGRSPRPQELVDYLDAPVEDVVESLSADGCFTPSSLDLPVGHDGDGSLGDLMADPSGEGFSAAEARIMLAPAVRDLPPRDQRILYLRFFKQWTQDQIAAEIGVTQMQVSRLLSRIMADLRGRLG
jgi:RNA polymerase sigma-B factor